MIRGHGNQWSLSKVGWTANKPLLYSIILSQRGEEEREGRGEEDREEDERVGKGIRGERRG